VAFHRPAGSSVARGEQDNRRGSIVSRQLPYQGQLEAWCEDSRGPVITRSDSHSLSDITFG
jgi:hypothetical protein